MSVRPQSKICWFYVHHSRFSHFVKRKYCLKKRSQALFLHALADNSCRAPFGSNWPQHIAKILSEKLCAEEDQNIFLRVSRLGLCASPKASTGLGRPDVNWRSNDVTELVIPQSTFQQDRGNALTSQGRVFHVTIWPSRFHQLS